METVYFVHHSTHRRWRIKKVPFSDGYLKNQFWCRVVNHVAVWVSKSVQPLWIFVHLRHLNDKRNTCYQVHHIAQDVDNYSNVDILLFYPKEYW
jgi:hypothetical protein